jgi:D-glycero-D-manno-heptose 1,7-bisphosphate phosphatase
MPIDVKRGIVEDSAVRPALFLDRDGIINADRGFVARREDFVWQDGIFTLVSAALAHGFVPVVVTNQSGIGRGLYTEADYQTLTQWMLERFAAEHAPIARVYHCPYHPEAELPHFRGVHPWRKPAPGMLLAAQEDLHLDLGASILFGDRWSDVDAGLAAGVGTIVLVGPLATRARNGTSAQSAPAGLIQWPDMAAAVRWFTEKYAQPAGPKLGV